MRATKEWFGREFVYDLSLDLYPNILARLRGTPARLEDLFRAIPRAVSILRENDKWSIQEEAGHLLDLDRLWIDRLDDFADGAESLRAADLQNRKTHEARHNDRESAELLAAFRSLRAEFVGRLERFDETFIARTALHPRLQTPMRVIDHAFFVAEHDDHHLARIWAMIGKFTSE